MKCLLCESLLTEKQQYEVNRGKQKGYCSRTCSSKALEVEKTNTCTVCGESFILRKRQNPTTRTCSKKCEHILRSVSNSKANLRRAAQISDRMKHSNPMHCKITRDKVSKTLKRIGHKPPIQGGNGRGLTRPQQLLLDHLDSTYVAELVVNTGGENKLPNHVKIDIASIEYSIAIEVDGMSHMALAVQEKDKRKEEFLCGNGWRVLRFKNQEIMSDMKTVLSTISKLRETTTTL